jgi:hypothetical protein
MRDCFQRPRLTRLLKMGDECVKQVRNFGQMTEVLAARDTLKSEARLVLSVGKSENDAIECTPSFRNGKAWWYNNREISPLAGRQSVMNDNLSKEFDRITDLGKARSDEYTERLLAFVQDMEASGPEPFISLLADIALVRAWSARLDLYQ